MQNIRLERFGTTIQFPDSYTDDQINDAIINKVIPQLEQEEEERRRAEAERRKDETGLLEAFGTGLSRGIGQTSALLGDALPAIAADLVGADDYRDRQLQEYQESMARIERESPSAVPTFRDIDDAGDAGLYAAETIGQFIPSIVTSIAGGGVGGFVGKKAAEKFATKMVSDAAKKAAATKGRNIGFVAGTFAGSGSQTIPEAYTSIAEATGEPNAAAGLIVGGINASLDSILPLGIAKGLSSKARQEVSTSIMARMLGSGTKNAAIEGATEAAQEANQLLAADIINENPDFFRGENVDRILEAGIRGGIGGKAIGLVSGIPGPDGRPKVDQELVDAAEGFVEGRPELLAAPAEPAPEAPTPLLGAPRGEATVTRPGVEPPPANETADQRAQRINREAVISVQQQAIEAGDDPLVALARAESSGELKRFIDSEIAGQTREETVVGPSAAEQTRSPVSDLTGKQVLEFVDNNRGMDEQLDIIRDSGIPEANQLPRIRKRLREMNINAVTADNRVPSQVGQPILRPDATVDEDGRVMRTTREGAVEATDPAQQPRMSRRTDTQQGQELRAEVGPIVNSALLEALGMRGGEASMRPGETTPVDTDSPALLSAPAAFNTERYQGAVTYLTARLDELAGRGQQGRKLAESIRTQVMDDRSMNANDIVGAFMAADAVTETLGGEGPQGGVDVNFHRTLTKGGQRSTNGFKSYDDTIGGRNRAVMDLAFYHDDPVQVAQTAAHEAFHFLQDFYALESPTDAKLLASTYKTKDGVVNYKALPGSIKRLWRRHGVIRGMEGVNAHREALKGKSGALADVMASPSEFQAMTYEFYRRAQLAGEKNPLSGAFGRYFDFVGRFLPSLRNKLRGMGYQTPEDIFGRAARGENAQQLAGTELRDRFEENAQFNGEASRRIAAKIPEIEADAATVDFDQLGGSDRFLARTSEELEFFGAERPVPSIEAGDSVTGALRPIFERSIENNPFFVDGKLRAKLGGTLLGRVDDYADLKQKQEQGEPVADDDLLRAGSRVLVGLENQFEMEVLEDTGAPSTLEATMLILAPRTADGDVDYTKEGIALQRDATSDDYNTLFFKLSPKRRFLYDVEGLEEAIRKRNKQLTFPERRQTVVFKTDGTISRRSNEFVRSTNDEPRVYQLEIDFTIDNNFENRGNVSPSLDNQSEMFARLLVNLRSILTEAKRQNIDVRQVSFAGISNTKERSSRQRIYNRLAKSPVFKDYFPELDAENGKFSDTGYSLIPLRTISLAESEAINAVSANLARDGEASLRGIGDALATLDQNEFIVQARESRSSAAYRIFDNEPVRPDRWSIEEQDSTRYKFPLTFFRLPSFPVGGTINESDTDIFDGSLPSWLDHTFSDGSGIANSVKQKYLEFTELLNTTLNSYNPQMDNRMSPALRTKWGEFAHELLQSHRIVNLININRPFTSFTHEGPMAGYEGKDGGHAIAIGVGGRESRDRVSYEDLFTNPFDQDPPDQNYIIIKPVFSRDYSSMIGSVPEYKDGLTQGFLLVEAVENVSLYGLQTAMETLGPKMAANQGRPATTKVPRKVEVYASHQAGMIFDLEARNVDLDKFLPDDFVSTDRYINSIQVDFTVDDYFSARDAAKPSRAGLSKIFASVIAGIRKNLDALESEGYKIGGSRDDDRSIHALHFAGNTSKKQKIYLTLARTPEFQRVFPEFNGAEIFKQGDRAVILTRKPKVPSVPPGTEVQLDLFGEASLRLDRVADLSQVPANPANDSVANAFGLNPMMRALSALDMLYNPEYQPDIPDRDTSPGRDGKSRSRGRNVGEIGRSLQNKARALIGTITAPNPETDEMLARIIAAETAAAMQNNPDTNASDWYSKNVEAAVQAVAKLYPEVATDPRHRSAFALSLALTSQGIKVSRNADIGLAAYEFWRENGRFPVFGEGTASRAIRSNFRLANQLIQAFDKEGANFTFEDFLTQQYTKKELLTALDDAGIPTGKGGVTLSGENVTATLYGSAVFGPKIGQGFYQNLMGNFDPITIDKWFMRTWGRLTGVLVGKPKLQENVENLATAMRAEGIEFDPELYGADEQYTLDTITRVFNMGEKFYADNRDAIEAGETEKSPAMREAARAVTNGLFTIDSPAGGTQREWIRSVIRRAREVLAENGINVSSADLQAIVWYPEKDLYALLRDGGQEERLNQSYEDAYEELFNGEAGLRTVDGRGRFDDVRRAIRAADRKAGTSTRKASGQEASIRFSTGDYRTTEGMRRNLANPETQGVLDSVSNFVWRARNEEGFLKGQGRRFINEFVHGLAPIARRELELSERTRKDADGKPLRRYLPFAQGAFKITEMAQQMSGRMEMFSRIGAPKLNPDGSVGIAENTMGLKQIFEPIGTGERYAKFQMFVYAQRAQRLKQEGRENLMSDADIAEGLRYGRENPEFNEVFRNYTQFNEALMQFLQDSGAINAEQKQKLIGTADYVPFYRIIDEEQYTEGLFGQVRRGNEYARNSTSAFDNPDARIKDVLQKLKGGEERIGDLYENIFSNTQAIVHAGMRNVATQRVVNVVEQLKRTGYYGVNKKPKRISKDEAQQNNNHFTYRENGKTVFYDVGTDGELITAMRTFTPTQLQGLLRTMQNIGRFFRNAITITPSFMIANLIRGDMAGVVTTDAPLRPMVDTIRGLKNALQDTETVQEMKTIGGFGGYTFGESSTDFAKKMKRYYRRHEGYTIVDTPQKLTDMFANMVDRINYVGEATELATREAIYRRLIEGGADKADAAYEALNLINYSRRGNPQGGLAQTFALLVPLVPFLNARVQGLYRTGTAFGTEATARKTAVKGLALMGMSLGLYAIMSQQDDWDKEPLHRKLNYYIIYAGDKKFLIPKPFEVGAIFSTIPEVFIDGIRNKDGEYVAEAVSQIFLNNFSFNPIPQAISPVLEVATNRDFFRGRELESLGVRGLPTEMRAYSTTSEFAKLVGQGSAAMGISPIEFEQLVNGYLGSLGGLFLGGMDSVLGTFGTVPEKPAGIFGDGLTETAARNLGITRFIKDRPADPSNRYLSEFYEMKREADELLRGINRLREEGNIEEARALKKANRGLLAVRTTLNKKYSTLNSINDKIAGVKTSGMEPDEKKKRIDTLIKQRNRIVSDMARLKERIRG